MMQEIWRQREAMEGGSIWQVLGRQFEWEVVCLDG